MSPKPIARPPPDIAKRVRSRQSKLGEPSGAAIGAAVVALLAVAIGGYVLLRSHVHALTPGDTAALKEAFYSGEPWVVECTKARKASQMVYDAEGTLKGVKMGTLDCDAVLPSGKTTYERFKLRAPSYGPVVLAMSNGERPQFAPRNVLTSGHALAAWATGTTAAKVFAPTSTALFDSQCVRKPWCVVVVAASGRLVDLERSAAQSLASTARRVRVVRVDSSKYNLLLDLPNGGVPPPTSSEATVLLLKQLPRSAGAEAADDGEGATGEEEGADGGAPPVAATVLAGGLRDLPRTLGEIGAALGSVDEVPAGLNFRDLEDTELVHELDLRTFEGWLTEGRHN